MEKKELVQSLNSIYDHVRALGDMLEHVPNGVKIKARIPVVTQSPVGDMIARELLPQQTPEREIELSYALGFEVDSLEVEIPNLIAALESEEE
jgi:hypothetical protein